MKTLLVAALLLVLWTKLALPQHSAIASEHPRTAKFYVSIPFENHLYDIRVVEAPVTPMGRLEALRAIPMTIWTEKEWNDAQEINRKAEEISGNSPPFKLKILHYDPDVWDNQGWVE